MTTIKVPKNVRDIVMREAKKEGLTLAKSIERRYLGTEERPRPRPHIGGYNSGNTNPLTAEELDADLRNGFGE